MMFKLVSPGDWDFGMPTAALVKAASGGLRGADRSGFLKRASHLFLDCFDGGLFRPGEVPFHAIGLGTTEAYGPNKNGDGFKAATCRDRVHTFEKYAHIFRDHRNKDPEQSYGRIVKAAVNEPMGRVELLCALNGTKEAADRNKGLAADKELEAIERDGDLRGSMACKVGHDVCSYCGNKAKNRSEYCGPSKKAGDGGCDAGGCRDNLGRVVKLADGRLHHLHVDNPPEGLTWFDYSHITNRKQADRTAMGVVADWVQKAASLGGPAAAGGAALAEAAGVDGPRTEAVLGMAKLAAAMEAIGRLEPWADEALRRGLHPALRPAVLVAPGDPRRGEKLAALADAGVVLTAAEYAACCGAPAEKTAAAAAVSGYAAAAASPYAYEPHWRFVDAEPSDEDRAFAAAKRASACTPEACQARAVASVVARLPAPPAATGGDPSGGFAAYKLAALWRCAAAQNGNFGLTARAARVQDRIA